MSYSHCCVYLHFHKLRSQDEGDSRATLNPHDLGGRVVEAFAGTDAAFRENSVQRVDVRQVVAGPIVEAGLHDLELKGQDAFKEPITRTLRGDAVEDREKVGAFSRGLVE